MEALRTKFTIAVALLIFTAVTASFLLSKSFHVSVNGIITDSNNPVVSGECHKCSSLALEIGSFYYSPEVRNGRWRQSIQKLPSGSHTVIATATNLSGKTLSDTDIVFIQDYTSPIIVTGSYIGSGTSQFIPLKFQPDLVLVKGENQLLAFFDNLIWHGRTNHLDAADSFNGLSILKEKGFTLNNDDVTNKLGTKYFFLAIKDNGSRLLQITSWLGNATDDRQISWATAAPEFVMVKRDSPRAAVFRHRRMKTAVRADVNGGVGEYIKALTATGVIVNDSDWTNENNNAGRGEGIEAIAFTKNPNFKILQYSGDGKSKRKLELGFKPAAIMIFRDAEPQKHAPLFATASMPEGQSGRIDDSPLLATDLMALNPSGVQLNNSTYNEAGVTFSVIAFKESTPREATQAPYTSGNSGLRITRGESPLVISDPPVLGNQPYSIEWYGRPKELQNPNLLDKFFMLPLFMMGYGHQQTNGEASYDGGFYLTKGFDPDGHGWPGYVLRIITSDYHALTKNEGSINYHNWNTGLRVEPDADIHIVITHDGHGWWQVYFDGQKVKDRRFDLTQHERVNGGNGQKTVATIGGLYTARGAQPDSYSLDFYRSSIYGNVLSGAEIKALYQAQVLGGPLVTHLDPLAVYDANVVGGIQLNRLPIFRRDEDIGETTVASSEN